MVSFVKRAASHAKLADVIKKEHRNHTGANAQLRYIPVVQIV